MTALRGQVALVTGASRGVGRGVALGLAHAGARVFATGRSIAHAAIEPGIEAIVCDHTDDLAVADLFRHIEATAGRLDLLVNVAWGGYERMVEDVLNATSRAALARIGAIQEGIFRRHLIAASGRRRDMVYFAILDEEWPEAKTRLNGMLRARE